MCDDKREILAANVAGFKSLREFAKSVICLLAMGAIGILGIIVAICLMIGAAFICRWFYTGLWG